MTGGADVLVVGGGPAGLYAAQRLAGHGLRVRVLEEHPTIGLPVHCTGIVGTETFRLPGVPRDAILRQASTARFHAPSGLTVAYDGPPGEACVIARGAFDQGLAMAAAGAGAEVVTGARVVSLTVGADQVELESLTPDGPRRDAAALCVLACGASYRLQRRLGWGLPSLSMVGAQGETAVGPGEALEVFSFSDVAPAGFGWLVPLGGDGAPRAKVGVMASTHPRAALARLVGTLGAAGRITGDPHSVVTRPLPLGPLARTYGDRVLAIGDAAGLVKPTTGGGIYYSLLSAGWAAATVQEAFERGDFSAARLASYEATWRATLGAELRAGVWFRKLAARLAVEDLDDLAELAVRDGVMPVVRAHSRFDWHGALIHALVRHPGILRILLRRLAGAMLERAP